MKREQSKLRQSFYARFEEEIKQAEEESKKNNNDIGVVSNDKSRSSNKTKPVSSQELEDLADDIKQSFIRDYKTCYSE